MKYILEYEDHEIQDLLGDLETIGQTFKREYCIWIQAVAFSFPGHLSHNASDYTGRLKIPFAKGEFWSRGSLEKDQDLIMKSLKSGNFVRSEILPWEFLSTSNPEIKHGSSRQRSLDLIRFLGSSSLKDFLREGKSNTLPELLTNLREKTSIIFEDTGQRQTKIVLLYGEEGDPEFNHEPNGSFYKSGTSKVILEDLTQGEDHPDRRIYFDS